MEDSMPNREPRCLTFTTNQAPHQVSFCPRSWTSTDSPPSTLNTSENAILFPTEDFDLSGDRWYVFMDSYSVTLRLPLGGVIPPLAQQIWECTNGIVCITMMDKGRAEDISLNGNKYEAVYPKNVLSYGSSSSTTTSGGYTIIKDTILHEEAYHVTKDTYATFVEGPVAHHYAYLTLPTDHKSTAPIPHPIFYPLPTDLPTDYDRKSVTLNIYLKLPHVNEGANIRRRFYIPLFDGQTGAASSLVYDSFIKLKICNEAYLQENKLGPLYCTDVQDDMSFGAKYLLGTVNTLTYGTSYKQYPLKVNFTNAAIQSNEQIRRDDLQLDANKTWEIAVTRVTYNLSESQLIMIPHPSVAQQTGIYDLYAGEIMIGPCAYYPILSTDDMPPHLQYETMGTALTKIYSWNKSTQSEFVAYANEHFGRLYTMTRELRAHLSDNTTTGDTWYTQDLQTTFDHTITALRCPVFRWNYTDKLLDKHPTRFQINNNEFGLFSLREIIDDVTFVTQTEINNAQQWAQAYRIAGWHWRYNIIGKRVWYNIGNSLPKLPFTLLDHTNQSTDSTITNYSIKIEPTYGTAYIALGSKMSKMFGFTHEKVTRKLMDMATGTVKRQALNIIYDNIRESYISPCQMVSRAATLAPVAPRPYTHESQAPAPGPTTKTYLWSLPKLHGYTVNSLNYYYLPDEPRPVYSDAVLDTVGGDDILIYTNILPNITSIGNHSSPLLVQIPCPAHMFGRSRMDIPYSDLADKTRIMTTHTWEIENPQFSTLAPGVNLDDMLVSVANSYGDRLHLGVMDIQIIVREKK